MNKRASGVLMHVSSLPGVPNGNWAFRVTQEQLDGIDKKWLKGLNDVYYNSKRPAGFRRLLSCKFPMC